MNPFRWRSISGAALSPARPVAEDADSKRRLESPAESSERPDLLWRSALGGLALAAGISVQGHAAAIGLEGRWDMAPATSSFHEGVTGPAPDQAVMVVTRDEPGRFTYRLVESLDGAEVAQGFYDLTFQGKRSSVNIDGNRQNVIASREAAGDVVIKAPAVGGLQAVIKVQRTGPDTAIIEHFVDGPQGELEIERLSMVRHTVDASAAGVQNTRVAALTGE
jgi:hypothetical protein